MEVSLRSTWRDLTGRLAAAVGTSTALLSLLVDVPIGAASLRGAAAWLGVTLVGRLGCLAVGRAVAGDLATTSAEE